MRAEPFTVEVLDPVLKDLRQRLARTRWPVEFACRGWADGASIDYLETLIEWWRDGFNWRDQEARVNAFPQFIVSVDGVAIHCIHGSRPES